MNYVSTTIANYWNILSASTKDKVIDSSVSPYDSFYDYAYGRFITDNTLHERKYSLNTFSFIDEKL